MTSQVKSTRTNYQVYATNNVSYIYYYQVNNKYALIGTIISSKLVFYTPVNIKASYTKSTTSS